MVSLQIRLKRLQRLRCQLSFLMQSCRPPFLLLRLGVVRGHQGAGQGWANRVPTHAHLGGFGDGLACGAAVDAVAFGEALGAVQLGRIDAAACI